MSEQHIDPATLCADCDKPWSDDQVCPLCEGWGVRTETIVEYVRSRPCTSCDGTGNVPRPYGWRPHEPMSTSIVRCDECNRTGRDAGGRRCRGCNGSGYVERWQS